MLVVICSCTAKAAQESASWVSRVELTIAKQEPQWTIADKQVQDIRGYFHEVLKLKSRGLHVEINIGILPSAKEAKEEFDGQKIAFTNILEKDAVKSRLDGLGDDNFMFSGRGKLKSGNVFLLQDNVVVQVFSNSAEMARRFVKYVVDLIPHRTSACSGLAGQRSLSEVAWASR
jgi:hypothetical protein